MDLQLAIQSPAAAAAHHSAVHGAQGGCCWVRHSATCCQHWPPLLRAVALSRAPSASPAPPQRGPRAVQPAPSSAAHNCPACSNRLATPRESQRVTTRASARCLLDHPPLPWTSASLCDCIVRCARHRCCHGGCLRSERPQRERGCWARCYRPPTSASRRAAPSSFRAQSPPARSSFSSARTPAGVCRASKRAVARDQGGAMLAWSKWTLQRGIVRCHPQEPHWSLCLGIGAHRPLCLWRRALPVVRPKTLLGSMALAAGHPCWLHWCLHLRHALAPCAYHWRHGRC